ncbi:MAG: hypothetical protein HYX39_13505 [Bacteroidetes bacterium]|nr:hypothetical protein [Bacteroidota bacterium]
MKVLSKCLYSVCFLILVSILSHFLIPQNKSSAIVESRLRDSSEYANYQKDVLSAHTKKINLKIAEELQQIHSSFNANLALLEATIQTYGCNSAEVKNVSDMKFYQDSINLAKVEQILNKYGWLGSEQIGAQNNYTLFTTIQNADFETQEKYIPLMERAVKSGTLEPLNFANLIDRKTLVQRGQQIFGTQINGNWQTGEYKFAPIADKKHVNERRKEIGLSKLEEYAAQQKVQYNPS